MNKNHTKLLFIFYSFLFNIIHPLDAKEVFNWKNIEEPSYYSDVPPKLKTDIAKKVYLKNQSKKKQHSVSSTGKFLSINDKEYKIQEINNQKKQKNQLKYAIVEDKIKTNNCETAKKNYRIANETILNRNITLKKQNKIIEYYKTEIIKYCEAINQNIYQNIPLSNLSLVLQSKQVEIIKNLFDNEKINNNHPLKLKKQ